MQAQSKGHDIPLVFDEDIRAALAKVCQLDQDSDGIHLAKAAQIIRQQLFDKWEAFDGVFHEVCQENSVPSTLRALVSMILSGAEIEDQTSGTVTPAALAIAQLLRINSVKHSRKETDHAASVRHSSNQETPVPMYVGLMLHAQTHKRDLVEKLCCIDLSISYDCILLLSAHLGNEVCEHSEREKAACPTKLRGGIFPTAAVDNTDHNPSSTTSKDSFHGTAISLFQHPSFASEGIDRGIIILGGQTNLKTLRHLLGFYADIPPVSSDIKDVSVPACTASSLAHAGDLETALRDEYK